MTSGAAQITITPAEAAVLEGWAVSGAHFPREHRVTAGKFDAQFATCRRARPPRQIHGAPDARIVNSAAGQPDASVPAIRSTPFFFRKAASIPLRSRATLSIPTASRPTSACRPGRIAPATLLPTRCCCLRAVRASPAAAWRPPPRRFASIARPATPWREGDVKSTYSEVKEQPDGALLASSSPIHVTAHSMTAHNSPGVALYSGNARLWQDANIIEAPTIQFDRDRRFVTAQGTAAQPVQTILVQEKRKAGKAGKNAARAPEKSKHRPSRDLEPDHDHRQQAYLRRFRTEGPLRRRSSSQGRRLYGNRQNR